MFVDHMHQPWRSLAAIINKPKKTASNDKLRKSIIDILWGMFYRKNVDYLEFQHYHTIKYDGIVCRLKFVRIGEDYQEYGFSIPKIMLTEAIKQSESSQMFIKYSTGQIPPKKSKGKVKRKTSSKRRVNKIVTLCTDDNIFSDDPDTALELGKSISQTKAEEAEEDRQVHATHARIVTAFVPKPAKRRK
nr:hypothetical protein [Tanacetum cinerariifolium]